MAKANDFRVLLVMAAAALAAALLVLVAAGKPAQAAFPGLNGLIVFTSDRDSTDEAVNDDIYAMNSDGSKTIRLTTDPAFDQFPALSPDGTEIAFQRFQSESTFFTTSEIYVMDIKDEDGDGNGDNLTQLTNNSAFDSGMGWSHDGARIAFTSNRPAADGTRDTEVYVMDAKDKVGDKGGDGNGDNLTQLTNNTRFDGQPVFSPDGTKIAFLSTRVGPDNLEGDFEIYVMNTDGSNQTNLTNNTLPDGNSPPNSRLAWSPDGTKIAFQRFQDGNHEIYVMNADGSNQTNLTNKPLENERYPTWSPDGTKIAFWKGGFSDSEIYVMDTDPDTNDVNDNNLTNNNDTEHPVGDIQPDWGTLTEEQCKDNMLTGDLTNRHYIFEILGFASEDECKSFVETGG